MKTILITLLLLSLAACDENRIKTGTTSLNYNQVGEQFMASFVKNNPENAYRHLDRSLTRQLSLNNFRRLNSKMFERYGKPVTFNKAAKPMRSVRVLPNGGNQRVTTLWYPVKTTRDMSGTLRLKLAFGNSRNPKIVSYRFMRPRN